LHGGPRVRRSAKRDRGRHATYGKHEAVISIDTLALLRGSLPRRALALVLEWATLHALELWADWHRARQGLPLAPIAPLD
jgi:Domain of unknown function (DUF4160)